MRKNYRQRKLDANLCRGTNCVGTWALRVRYRCKIFNDRKPKIEYKRIFKENVKIQKDILERFRENFEKRNEIRNESVPLDPCG